MARREKRDVVLLSSWLALLMTRQEQAEEDCRSALATVKLTLRLLLQLVSLGRPLPPGTPAPSVRQAGAAPNLNFAPVRCAYRLSLTWLCPFRASEKLIRRNCSERDLGSDTYWCSPLLAAQPSALSRSPGIRRPRQEGDQDGCLAGSCSSLFR